MFIHLMKPRQGRLQSTHNLKAYDSSNIYYTGSNVCVNICKSTIPTTNVCCPGILLVRWGSIRFVQSNLPVTKFHCLNGLREYICSRDVYLLWRVIIIFPIPVIFWYHPWYEVVLWFKWMKSFASQFVSRITSFDAYILKTLPHLQILSSAWISAALSRVSETDFDQLDHGLFAENIAGSPAHVSLWNIRFEPSSKINWQRCIPAFK